MGAGYNTRRLWLVALAVSAVLLGVLGSVAQHHGWVSGWLVP